MQTDSTQTKQRVNILDLRDSPWVDGPGRTILDCASSIEGDKFHFIIGTFDGGRTALPGQLADLGNTGRPSRRFVTRCLGGDQRLLR